jgi:hypothetical protein
MGGYIPIQMDWQVVQLGRVIGTYYRAILLWDLTRGFVACTCLGMWLTALLMSVVPRPVGGERCQSLATDHKAYHLRLF